MKKFLALLLALVMVFALAACGEADAPASDAPASEAPASDAPASEAPADGAAGSVYYLNFKPEQDAQWQELATYYTEQTGVPVKVVTAASGEYETYLTSEMAKEDAPTLFQVNGPVGLASWKDYCYDLAGSAIYGELTSTDYALTEGDVVYGIGYVIESYGLIVNTDLLSQAGYTVDDIQSFADLKAVAEDITARKDELGFADVPSPGMDGSSDWRNKPHLANLPIYFEYQDKGISSTDAIEGTYLDNYRAMWDLYINNSTCSPAELTAKTANDTLNEFLAGQAVFYQNGSWEWAKLTGTGDGQYGLDNLSMIPFYCGVAGEENAGLNCGTENCWAVNAKASEEDIQATLEFMNWMVTDPEVSRMLVDEFAAMPYKQAAESTNGFLADANDYTTNGNYIMPWVTNFQPNVDAYRAALVSAMNQYDADQSDANWELVKTAFVDGWATQYAAANG